jgi:nucleotide-binding universal stress UspA family protein
MPDVAQPALLCFDGSDDAGAAITAAAKLLGTREAVLITVWEPVSVWAPYDPAAFLGAGVGKLGSHALGLDEIAEEVAEDNVQRGIELARQAGFETTGRTVRGKTWQAICDTAAELDAAAIVLGARGLSRVSAMLLGSVSAAVVAHARRPVLVIPHHRGEEDGD